MNKREITAGQTIAVITLYLTGSSLISGDTGVAKQDTWICIVFSFILILPILWIYSEILSFSPEKDFYCSVTFALGKTAAKIICLLYFFYAVYTGALVLRIFSEFIHIVNMVNTPIIAIIAAMMLASIYLVKKRLYVLGRISKFTMPFLEIALFITVILSVKDMNFTNIKPVLYHNTKPVISNTLLIFTLPFGESVICMPLFAGVEHNEKILPIFLKGALFGFINLILANLRNIFVLGYSSSIYDFPSYESVSVISIGEFFTRIEVFIGINLLLAGFIKICVSLYSSCFFLSKAFGFEDYAKLSAPCGLIIILLSIIAHNNTVEMFSLVKFYPYYCIPLQIIIPVIILIFGKIKKHRAAIGKLQKSQQ